MNAILIEMLGRQRYREMVTAAEEARRISAGPARGGVGALLIRLGRGLERAGERLSGPAAAQRRAVGGLR